MHIKTVQDYRHNIKLLKYHLKKERKQNEKLRYESAKVKHKPQQTFANKNRVYELNDTIKVISNRLKKMGLILEDLFRMADSQYEGQITKEQFLKVVGRLKVDLSDQVFLEMFYNIDTSLNGLISSQEFTQFSVAYGGCSDPKEIRRYQNKTKSRFHILIDKKYGSLQTFLDSIKDPLPIDQLSPILKELGLNGNEEMVLIKTFDPSHTGYATHRAFLTIMATVKIKDEKQEKVQEETRNVQQFCVVFRDKKINPIVVFEEADTDGKNGVSPLELETAFVKMLPDRTPFQIRKWVSMMNFDKNSEITKEQYLNAIRGFYSINQLSKFTEQYKKKHPEKYAQAVKEKEKMGKMDSQDISSILRKLSIAIEDKGMKKKEAFNFIDFNKNGNIDNQELMQGLKSLGIHFGIIANVMAVFDRDGNANIQVDQWLKILGADDEISDIPLPDDEQESETQQPKTKPKQETKKKQIPTKIPQVPVVQQKQKKKINESVNKNDNKMPNKSVTKPIQTSKQKNEMDKSKAKPIGISQSKEKPIGTSDNKEKPIGISDNKEKKPIPNKKFLEDSGSNNTQSKLNLKKTESINIRQEDEERNQPETSTAQQKIAKTYKKQKKNTLKMFQDQDRNSKGYLTLKLFNDLMKKFDVSDEVGKQIFLNNVTNGNEFHYEDWLEQIADNYAQDVEQEFQLIPQKPKPAPPKPEDKPETKPAPKPEYKPQDKPDSKPEPKPKSIEVNYQLINKLIPKIENNSMAQKQKRGEDHEAYAIDSKGKLDENFRLFNFISDEEGDLDRMVEELIFKSQKIKAEGKIYKDNTFPANKSSISTDPETGIKNSNLLEWKHYSEIYKNPQLFKGVIQPNDIMQGQLGDCYFLSSIAGLSEYRKLIERLFEYSDIKTGYFLVWLCIDGQWKLVQVDGYLPVWPNSDRPAFSHSTEEEVWVCILEKAYAKCFGSYKKIIGGIPFQAIKDLSGAPGFQYNFSKINMEETWKRLCQANAQQFIMAAGTKQQQIKSKLSDHEEGINNNGIVLGHAYSILDCQQVNGQRILKLRNPWGQFEWSGDEWSDKGNKWTPEMKKKLNYQINQNDGIFWITIEQFYNNFMSFSINELRPTYFYRSDTLKGVQQVLVCLSLDAFQHGYIMLSHKDHRHNSIPINTPYDGMYSMLGFVERKGQIVEKIEDKKFLYEREGYVEFKKLEKYGKQCRAMVLINLAKTTNVTIAYYGNSKIDFEIETDSKGYTQKLAYMGQNDQKTANYDGELKGWASTIQGYEYLCFKALKKDMKLKVTIKEPKNLAIAPPFGIQNTLALKAGQIKSIKMKVTGAPFSYSYGLAY